MTGNPKEPLVYTSGKAPDWYVCEKCGATNVKLWRDTGMDPHPILCVNCAETYEGKVNIAVNTNDQGTHPSGLPGYETDQIGWHLPCVPHEELEDVYWGYTSIPQAGIDWWKKLPTHPAK